MKINMLTYILSLFDVKVNFFSLVSKEIKTFLWICENIVGLRHSPVLHTVPRLYISLYPPKAVGEDASGAIMLFKQVTRLDMLKDMFRHTKC